MEVEGIYKEENENFLNQLLERMEDIREEEFRRVGFEYDEFQKKEVVHKELRMEMREHQKKMRQQDKINKGRSARNDFVEVETVFDGCDNLIFSDEFYKPVVVRDEEGNVISVETVKKENKKVEDYTKEELVEKMGIYMKKKGIQLNQIEENRFNKILEENEDWPKHIILSKETGEIMKIGFLKKGEYGVIHIGIEEEIELTKEEKTVIAKRKNMLKKFK